MVVRWLMCTTLTHRRPYRWPAGVRIWTRVGWIVLASDASHYYANMTERRPFPIVADVTQMADGWRKLGALADAPQYVIPGHDPLVMQRYEASEPLLQGIAVRLDAEPMGFR